jgi:exopolysaccharide production protein ExoQ
MGRFKDYFTIFAIIFMTGINFSPAAARSLDSADVVAGNFTTQIIKSALYLIAFCILIIRWKYAVKLAAKNIIIWVILLWVFTTFVWSEEPSLTLRTSAALLGTTVIALYIAIYYDYGRFALVAAWSFLIVDILSSCAIAFFPSLGISWDPYGWRGIYFTKNGLGINSLYGMILFTTLLTNKKTAKLGMVGLILSSILLIGSRSVTSLISCACALSIWMVLQAYLHKNRPFFISLIISFFIVCVIGMWLFLTNNAEIVVGNLGKDLTFTGRTPIWEGVLFFIRQNPWLGYGYGAVWIGKDYGIGSFISDPMNYYVVNSHNGYLDLLLEIGAVGVALVSLVIITILYKQFSILGSSTRLKGSELWPIVFLITLIVYNSTEANLLVQNSVAWIFIAFLGFATPGNQRSQSSAGRTLIPSQAGGAQSPLTGYGAPNINHYITDSEEGGKK